VGPWLAIVWVMLAASAAILEPAGTAKAESEDYLRYVTKCLDTAGLFAKLIEANLPPRACLKESWYRGYAENYAPRGTYAGLYGQSVSFFLHMYLLTGEPRYLRLARGTADDAIARLFHNGLFRGHSAKPYYEAVDGVGYLLYALLELDQVIKHRARNKALDRDAGP